ncbi:MAG TPA: hypothetical protein VGA69_02935 [Nitriliruptorales bacterium]
MTWGRQHRRDHVDRYAPLLSMVVAMLLAVLVLPSALNVPQSNPSQTLEFAPVPPEDDEPPPPDVANVESLGLGSSAGPAGDGAGSGAAALPPPPAAPPVGAGGRPVTKRCVGDPPRQTEDPLAPPCVAHFEGDNFGATYQGVTADEIRVLLYFDGSPPGTPRPTTSRGSENIPGDQFFDLGEEPQGDEFVNVRQLRLLQRYFNERYQTYGRTVRFVVHFGNPDDTPESRRADATAGATDWEPFAVIAFGRENVSDYVDEMAQRDVVNVLGRDIISYEGRAGRAEDFYRGHPARIWSYDPSLDRRVELFASHACTKAAPHPASFSGNPGDNGQPRSFGIVLPDDPDAPEANTYGAMIRTALEQCGIEFDGVATVASASTGLCRGQSEAIATLSEFRQTGVTTIVKAGGFEVCYSQAAATLGYRPEWLVPGDSVNDANIYSRQQDQTAWAFARAVSTHPVGTVLDEEVCFQAQREADPSTPRSDARFGCGYYDELRQLFTGIQVAGPRLTPENMDRGFHAIPAIQAGDPRIPACFYRPGDYSCVKDAQALWWDPTGQAPGRGEAGCWRIVENGRRYLPGDWPPGDIDAQRTTDDPCNGNPAEELS